MSKLHTYILLDRSGSMETRWTEALGSINAYVDELAKGDTKGRVTVAAFDTASFDVLRDAVPLGDWSDVTSKDAQPRGGTPLYDSVGKMVARMEEADKKRSVLVVMTDGYENTSHELTKEAAKALLDRCKGREWQTVFLGADFDAVASAATVGVAMASSINATAGNYGATMRGLAGQTKAYAVSGSNVSFSDEDRKEASSSVS